MALALCLPSSHGIPPSGEFRQVPGNKGILAEIQESYQPL
jgi:hypothetical protein